MFGFKPKPDGEDGAQDRYEAERATLEEFSSDDVRSHRAWWVAHNCVAHPLIGLWPCRTTFDLHDYTARRMHGLATRFAVGARGAAR